MSDGSAAHILVVLERLEQGQARLEEGQARLRADLMARMDRLQHRMDSFDEHLTMGLGNTDQVEKRSQAVAEDYRLLGEQLQSLRKLMRQLEGRIGALEEKQ